MPDNRRDFYRSRRGFLAAIGLAPVAAVVPAAAKAQQSVDTITVRIDASDVHRWAAEIEAAEQERRMRRIRT